MTFIAGPYTMSYDGSAIGIVEQGFYLEQVKHSLEIRGDNKGESVQDTINQGEDWFVDFVMQEYNVSVFKMLHPFQVAAAATPVLGRRDQVGQTAIGSSRAKILILTAVAGTPAATSPATLDAQKAIIAPGQNTRILFGSKLRQVPMRQILLPNTVSTNDVNFTTT